MHACLLKTDTGNAAADTLIKYRNTNGTVQAHGCMHAGHVGYVCQHGSDLCSTRDAKVSATVHVSCLQEVTALFHL